MVDRGLLISGISAFREGRRRYDDSRIFWLQSPVNKFEIGVVMLRADVLLLFSGVID